MRKTLLVGDPEREDVQRMRKYWKGRKGFEFYDIGDNSFDLKEHLGKNSSRYRVVIILPGVQENGDSGF